MTKGTLSKVQRELEARIAACHGDEERVEVLRRAVRFKASWVELAEALTLVRRESSWRDWGYPDFESYCRQELHIKKETAHKLAGSYDFLQRQAPDVLQGRDPTLPADVPPLESVAFWQRAEEQGASNDAGNVAALRAAVLEEGLPAASLRRRFGETFFPVDEAGKAERDRAAVMAAAKRLSQLLKASKTVPSEIVDPLRDYLEDLVEHLAEDEPATSSGTGHPPPP